MYHQLRFSIWFPIVLIAAFAAGYLFWQQVLIPGPYDLEPITTIRNRGVGVDTSDWQTYQNNKYGFEVKLPDSWGVLDNNPAGVTLDISFRDKKYANSFEWPGLKVSTIDVTGEFAGARQTTSFRPENAKNEVIKIYFSRDGKIIYASCSLYLDSSVIQKCNQILSTLKFTTTDETADWERFIFTTQRTKSIIPYDGPKLPDISFKLPKSIGGNGITTEPFRVAEYKTSNWVGLLIFEGLGMDFSVGSYAENNFKSFVNNKSAGCKVKFFKVESVQSAHVNCNTSPTDYDADVTWGYLQLPSNMILSFSLSGDVKTAFDYDKDGNSTRDKILSTFKFLK